MKYCQAIKEISLRGSNEIDMKYCQERNEIAVRNTMK